MKHIVLSAIFLMSYQLHAEEKSIQLSPAYSNTDGSIPPEDSYFQKITRLFSEGSAPDLNTLVGAALVGRCYKAQSPNNAMSGAYIVSSNQKNGPLEAGVFKVRSVWRSSNAPDSNDSMTYKDIMQAYSDVQWKVLSIDESANAATHEIVDLKSTLRRSGDYFIELLWPKANPDPSTPFAACYYFITKRP